MALFGIEGTVSEIRPIVRALSAIRCRHAAMPQEHPDSLLACFGNACLGC